MTYTFLFHTGSIKSAIAVQHRHIEEVSIPYWFD